MLYHESLAGNTVCWLSRTGLSWPSVSGNGAQGHGLEDM